MKPKYEIRIHLVRIDSEHVKGNCKRIARISEVHERSKTLLKTTDGTKAGFEFNERLEKLNFKTKGRIYNVRQETNNNGNSNEAKH